ncbi:helix-turn-helix domain-containing protein [Streptomyces sp. NRRL F-5126]|uniref:helix-turn-helix domain-containing protein n=1 Tax=Streptomyces sp. NRRL F-5126 TaxID=1463857 RepID=UPI0004C6FE50|nr:helix-turn-helix transcriptional regulator [Streptomyces sp. NRRL F-5126]
MGVNPHLMRVGVPRVPPAVRTSSPFARAAGLTQEQLAEDASLSLSTIRKVEQGGSVSVETIHTLARALGTTTSSLFASGVPAPTPEPEGDGPKLMALRRALMPPAGLSAVLAEPAEARDLTAIQRDIDDQHAPYRTDRYDSVAKALPGILRSADAAVALSDGDASRGAREADDTQLATNRAVTGR